MTTVQLETINMEAKKIELISKITRLIDYTVLLELEKILYLSEQETDHWSNLTTSEKEKIEKGLDSIKQGKVISHKVVKQKIDQFISEKVFSKLKLISPTLSESD